MTLRGRARAITVKRGHGLIHSEELTAFQL